MMKRSAAIFLLSCLLIACTSPTPTVLPAGGVTPSQISAPSPTPLASVTATQTLIPSTEVPPTQIPTSPFSLERVAQVGGSINGITVVGDVAYVGMGPRLAAIDISQHEKPMLVSQSDPLPGLVSLVLQLSSEPAPLLLVNAGKYLVVMDASTPGMLKPIDQLEQPGAVLALVWDERLRIAYAEGTVYQGPEAYAGYISAVGIDQENHLKAINTVDLPERPWSLALGKECLYAGLEGYDGGLYYIPVLANGELSTPRLAIASTPERPLQPTILRVIGERLYLGYRGFEAYDITNPDQPVLAWAKGLKGGPVIASFSVFGKQVYVFGWTILSEFMRDVITLSEPIEGDPVGVTASVTAMHNGAFLVAYNDLKLYDTGDTKDLSLSGSFQPPVNNAIAAVANEKAVFVIDNGAGDGLSQASLKALSLPDLKLLGQVQLELPTDSHDIHGIALEGDRVYLAIQDSVWAYDVSSEEPSLLWKEKLGEEEIGKIAAFRLEGRRVLVVSQKTREASLLAAYDLTNLSTIDVMENRFSLEIGEIVAMAWNGSYLNVLLRPLYESKFAMLYRVEFEGNHLAMKDSLKVPGYFYGMANRQNDVALAGSETLAIVSREGTGPYELLSLSTLPETGLGAALLEDTELVVVGHETGAAQLLAYDLQDLSRPRRVEAMDIAVSNLYEVPILVTSSYIILVNGAGGVEVLQYSP